VGGGRGDIVRGADCGSDAAHQRRTADQRDHRAAQEGAPDAAALDFSSPFELLIALILAAQCNDEK